MLFDERFDAERDALAKEWGPLVCDAVPALCALAGKYRGGVDATYVSFHHGTFNLCFRLHWDDGEEDWLIRFPIPGKAFFTEEMVHNEVALMEYLHKNTSVPVPKVIAHGTADENPAGVGPFIIMTWIDGVRMVDLIRDKNTADGEDPRLDPNIGEEALLKLYSQVSKVLLDLWSLDFNSIGCFDFNKEGNTLEIKRPPFTIGGMELVKFGGFPETRLFSNTFSSSLDYFTALADNHFKHLEDQLNSVDNSRDCRQKYACRYLFKSIVTLFTKKEDNNGPFKLFCEDLSPANILVDPKTLKITGVIDWEFSYIAPAQFAAAPPEWLMLKNMDHIVEDEGLENTLRSYMPKFELFLRALEMAEEERYPSSDRYHTTDADKKLSIRMRQSLEDKTVWFNLALRNGWVLDSLYWLILDGHIYGKAPIMERVARTTGDGDMHRNRESFVRSKIEDLKEYNKAMDIIGRVEYEEPADDETPGHWKKPASKDTGTQVGVEVFDPFLRRAQAFAALRASFAVMFSMAIIATGIALIRETLR